ncbi:MAG TPA: TIGR03032 family protein [Thermoguttaceae bacterium]|nr:TIGR03032 family protein [Thermoguttaceae bacterium]
MSSPDVNDPSPAASGPADREVRYEHSRNIAPLLSRLRASLLVSTYQAGKLVVVGARQDTLSLAFHNFERPMGVAAKRGSIAVAGRNQDWFLRNKPHIAPRLDPAGTFDACYLTQSSQMTGQIQAHEMGWAGEELWVVNTLFSCLSTLHPNYSFVPRWRPPFISSLAPEDRCHLNGLAMAEGKPKYVTAMSETDTAAGWRPNKAKTGCLIDVDSGRTVARGFAMPHSPRVHRGKVWLLDSGRGQLVRVDPADGRAETVAQLPGYTRGLAFCDQLALIGLSRIRETSTFGGVPIAEDREKLKCGVAVVDLETGRTVATLEFKSGVEEIFDVGVLPGARSVAMRGPYSAVDGEPTIWAVPEPGREVPKLRGAPGT